MVELQMLEVLIMEMKIYSLPLECPIYRKGIVVAISPFFPFLWVSRLNGRIFSVPPTMKRCVAIALGKKLEVEEE